MMGKTGKTKQCSYEWGTHLTPEVKGTAEVFSSVVAGVLHNVCGLSKEATWTVNLKQNVDKLTKALPQCSHW